MSQEQESFQDALQRVDRAVRAVYAGEAGLFVDLWSRADDATLFGAFGPARRGWSELSPVFSWVASRYRGGNVDIDYVVACEGGDSAHTVGYERAHVSIDGGEPTDSTIRVTHVFRREDGHWKLLHRHGDFAPLDDGPPSGIDPPGRTGERDTWPSS